MTTISTVHQDGDTVRVVEEGAVKYRFDVDNSGDTPKHDYQGDGEPPDYVLEALDEWVAKYHGDGEEA